MLLSKLFSFFKKKPEPSGIVHKGIYIIPIIKDGKRIGHEIFDSDGNTLETVIY